MFWGVIFDMDGVLVDTEGYYARRRKEFLLAKGVPYEDSWDFTGLSKQSAADAKITRLTEVLGYLETKP